MTLGTLCLALFFFVYGLITLTGLHFDHENIVLGLLALVVSIAVVVRTPVVLRP